MLVRKSNCVGIDFEIDKIQSKVYKYLTEKALFTNYQSYPRAYINEHKGLKLPEFSIDKKDYKELLFNDKFYCTSFFVVDDSRNYQAGQHFEVECSLIFQANIKKLYTSVSHRADEEFNKDCFNALKNAYSGIEINNMITGIDNVYSDFDIEERLKIVDLSQNHVLKLSFNLKYKYCS